MKFTPIYGSVFPIQEFQLVGIVAMLAQGAAATSIASVSVAMVRMRAIIKIAICVNLPTSGEPLLMHGEAYNRVIVHRSAFGKRREAGTRFSGLRFQMP